MKSKLAIVLPISIFAAGIGAAAGGYAWHAHSTRQLVTCETDKPSMRKADASRAEPTHAEAWKQNPTVMDLSWRQWPSLTDF